MTCADAADELGTTLRELYRAIDAGRLSAYRIDAQIRLRRHEVECFARELHPSGG